MTANNLGFLCLGIFLSILVVAAVVSYLKPAHAINSDCNKNDGQNQPHKIKPFPIIIVDYNATNFTGYIKCCTSNYPPAVMGEIRHNTTTQKHKSNIGKTEIEIRIHDFTSADIIHHIIRMEREDKNDRPDEPTTRS